jgi:hypothetical protein
MVTISFFTDGFFRTTSMLKLLLGITEGNSAPTGFFTQFGQHGYCILVHSEHSGYLEYLNSVIVPFAPEFDLHAISRWRLANQLLLVHLAQPKTSNGDPLIDDYAGLAALAIFTVLEEVARKLCCAWEEDGSIRRHIPKSEGIMKRHSDGTLQPNKYNQGQRIVALSEKLQLMHHALPRGPRETLDSLDLAFQRSFIEGISAPTSPLYEKLQFFRDQWMHGVRYSGLEGLLVSLLMGLLYFGYAGEKFRQQETERPPVV